METEHFEKYAASFAKEVLGVISAARVQQEKVIVQVSGE
jgi:hypothetical protein